MRTEGSEELERAIKLANNLSQIRDTSSNYKADVKCRYSHQLNCYQVSQNDLN